MIKFTVLTLFPEQVESAFLHSIMKRAVEDGKIALECIDIRAYTKDPHGHVDDAPFGGGAGMLMQAEPIVRAFTAVREKNIPDRVIYCSPRGRVFHQNIAEELSRETFGRSLFTSPSSWWWAALTWLLCKKPFFPRPWSRCCLLTWAVCTGNWCWNS